MDNFLQECPPKKTQGLRKFENDLDNILNDGNARKI